MSSASPQGIHTETALVKAHGLAALAMVVYSVLLGIVMAIKFHHPDFLTTEPWLTWGRLRYAHTQGILFGWLGNAFLAFMYYAVPRLAERPITSRALGWLLFVAWNFGLVIPGWVLVQMGHSQPLEWGEFPLEVDAVATFAFLLSCIQFVVPFLRGRLGQLYVSGWYIIGGLVFTLFAFPVGQVVPELLPGATGATFSGLWIHDAVGLYVTPLAVAIAYVVIPAATGRPIYSHFLSMVAFWLLFLVYPLNGTHHYVFSSIPMDAQKGAIVASVYLGVDVILNVTNQLLSLRGSGGVVARDAPLRFIWFSVVTYLIVSMQGSFQALMPVNRFVHFSDWVIGHSHLAMIGFASFAAIGGMLHAWQRLPGLRYNARAANWAFWLLTVGVLLMASDLTAAGLVQGQMWQSDSTWLDSVRASQPYWLSRSFVGVIVLLGFVALILSMTTGPRGEMPSEPERQRGEISTEPLRDTDEQQEEMALPALRWLRNAYVLTAVAGLGFFVLSFLVLAVWPNQTLKQEIAGDTPAGLPALAANEIRGRAIYGREGCMNCHSQLIRMTEDDVRRFGVATKAWETADEYPQMWGTRRIGPDLARERGRKSRDWHLAHLWDPRWVVPDSNMPRYPWLFAGDVTQPTTEALDLIAYFESLGRGAALAGLSGPAPLPNMDSAMEKFCDCAIPRTPGPPLQLNTRMDPTEKTRFERRGADVYAHNCAGCHGPQGRGDGPAAVALLPKPRALATARFSDAALSDLLWNGVPGSSMPRWHDLPANDLRALAAYVQSVGEQPATEEPLAAADADRAHGLYVKNCQACHGTDGNGNVTAASAVVPAPTTFRRVRPTASYAIETITNGIPGTAMTPWKEKLPEEDRKLLAHYVRTLFAEE
jgi:cbb3-type cytochrome c oxidase subunit I/cbb3-type cytochrome c oxidase subunit II